MRIRNPLRPLNKKEIKYKHPVTGHSWEQIWIDMPDACIYNTDDGTYVMKLEGKWLQLHPDNGVVQHILRKKGFEFCE